MYPVETRHRGFVAVDVETTGFHTLDRVVEVAAVCMDEGGRVVSEWESLVDPGRHPGPTHIHQVTPSMLRDAPLFSEVAPELASLVNGRVLVAHNLAFDARFLQREFEGCGYSLSDGRGICTLNSLGGRLEVAAARHGISSEGHHRALSDARMVSQLLWANPELMAYGEPTWVEGGFGLGSAGSRALRREETTVDPEYDRRELEVFLDRLDAHSGWRSRPPTRAQVAKLERLGGDVESHRTRGEMSDAIGQLVAGSR